MAVVRKIQTMGGSRGVVLPRVMLEQLAWRMDAQVEIAIEGNRIVITPHRPEKPQKGRPQ